jgi:hypothetical protein
MCPYRHATPRPERTDQTAPDDEIVLAIVMIVIGLIPLVGYLLVGSWNTVELTVALFLVLAGGASLAGRVL